MESQSEAAEAGRPAGGPPHVLVIEDDPVFRRLLARHLEGRGYHVSMAAGWLQGGRLALSAVPDLITLDHSMPGGDGISLLQRLRQMPETADVPVVYLTAFSEPVIIEAARRAGATEILFKSDHVDRDLDPVLDRLLGAPQPSSEPPTEPRPEPVPEPPPESPPDVDRPLRLQVRFEAKGARLHHPDGPVHFLAEGRALCGEAAPPGGALSAIPGEYRLCEACLQQADWRAVVR